jgi:hypothetical protein
MSARTPALFEQRTPRFLAYCAEQGRTAEEQLAHDEIAFPGGRMAGFLVWTSERWREFRARTKTGEYVAVSEDEHVAFDAWLAERARAEARS